MYLKKRFYILIGFLIAVGFSSCLNDNNDYDDYFISKDAQLTSLTLSKGSSSAFNSVSFSIDQIESVVYNRDSLPYLTDIDVNVKINYQTGSGRTGNMFVDFGNDSTVWVATGDSINLSKIKDFTIYAPDGINKKTYKLIFSVHQIDPDSMQYKLWADTGFAVNARNRKTIALNGIYFTYVNATNLDVYQSEDLITWTKQSVTGLPNTVSVNDLYALNDKLYAAIDSKLYYSEDGLVWSELATEYPVVSVLGYLNTDRNKGAVFGFEKDGNIVSGLISETGEYRYGATLPEGMSFSSLITVPNKGITVVESLSKVWFSNDGLNWVKLENPNRNFPEIEGGRAFYYDNKVFFIGGREVETETEEYSQKVYSSRDSGLTWDELDERMYAPEEFVLRENASIVLDKTEEYFYIIGGENNTVTLDNIWRVAINSVTFLIK